MAIGSAQGKTSIADNGDETTVLAFFSILPQCKKKSIAIGTHYIPQAVPLYPSKQVQFPALQVP